MKKILNTFLTNTKLIFGCFLILLVVAIVGYLNILIIGKIGQLALDPKTSIFNSLLIRVLLMIFATIGFIALEMTLFDILRKSKFYEKSEKTIKWFLN